jgi:peptidyl-prolyl cis-trans isomerase A (cyclophilin A)/peptidyl-prolyl cis-trans isomerase B (cyclophilin B)
MRFLLAALLCLPLMAQAGNPKVALDTNMGKIVLELYSDKAPKTVENFLGYVDAGFYSDTIFHRVIRDFMIQGGGFDQQNRQKSTRAPVVNEADNGLRNERGTIAMARTSDPHSATAQFFINTVDNRSLDHTGKDARGWGYAVFGRVTEGMDVVDSIRATRTAQGALNGYPATDVPVMPIIIRSVSRVTDEPVKKKS